MNGWQGGKTAMAGALVWLMLAGGAPAAWEYTPQPAPAPGVPDSGSLGFTILEEDNAEVSPWAVFFVFDPPDHPKLVELRRRYRLDEVVAGATNDLQRAAALKQWTAAKLRFGTPGAEAFDDWSALAVLERAERGQGGWCGQAAMVMQQACLAMGLPARFIELGARGDAANHFTTEVFLREHGKWAVMDATPLNTHNVYYTVDGVPQSALEMRRHALDGTLDRVTEVRPGGAHPVQTRSSPAWNFYHIRWMLRCDVVSRTPPFTDMEHVFDRRYHAVEWVDRDTVPLEKQPEVTWWTRSERLTAWQTDDPAVVNWKPTDRVRMLLREVAEMFGVGKRFSPYLVHVNVQLWEADPAFDHFRIRLDNQDWRDLPQVNTSAIRDRFFSYGPNFFTLRLEWNPWQPDREYTVRARVARRDGSVGPESFVRFKLGWKQT